MKMQIAKLLLKEDFLSIEQIKEAVEKIHNTDMELGEALIELGYITESELLDFLGRSYGVPVISIEDHSIDQEVLELIPREIAIENRLIPLSVTGSALTVAMSDPSNIILVDEISFLTEMSIIPVVVSERSIIDMLEQYYGYSKNNSGLSPKPAGNDDIDKILRELQGYKDGDTSEVDRSNPDIEKENQSAVTEKTSDTEQPVGGAEPEHLYELKNDPGIFEETGIRDEVEIRDALDEIDDLPVSSEDLSSPNENENIYEAADSETKPETPVSEPKIMDAPSNESNPDGFNPSVLVIDNSRTVQKLITIALERSGYSVSAVSDGMEALSCLNEVKPDMIFVEINLPHMDGYQVCKIIKSHGLMKQVPVIMLSGKDGIVDKVRSKMAGANGHISKPFKANELVEAVQRYAGSNARGLVSGQS